MLKSENIKSFLCFSFLAKKKKSDLFISASYCLEKSPRWSTRPHLRTEVRKEARKGSESFSPPEKKKEHQKISDYSICPDLDSEFGTMRGDRQTERRWAGAACVCVCICVCRRAIEPSRSLWSGFKGSGEEAQSALGPGERWREEVRAGMKREGRKEQKDAAQIPRGRQIITSPDGYVGSKAGFGPVCEFVVFQIGSHIWRSNNCFMTI